MIRNNKEKGYKQLKSLLKKVEHKIVVIGCSGGVDSMSLLDIVKNEGKTTKIIVAHVHHGLRKSATKDQKIVTDYCKKHGILLETKKIDAKKEAKQEKMTIEEYARKVRYDFFNSLCRKYNANYILTAHHADDQAETLIYRITKGTSITGLVGIEESVGNYLRPMISMSKQDIIDYAEKNNIIFGYDETNEDVSIPRNRLRHNVLPELTKINPEAVSAIIRLGNSAHQLKKSFDLFFEKMITGNSFSIDWYHSLPLGFQHELLRLVYERTNGSTHGLSTSLLEELDRFLSTRNGGKKEIKKMKLEKKQGRIIFSEVA